MRYLLCQLLLLGMGVCCLPIPHTRAQLVHKQGLEFALDDSKHQDNIEIITLTEAKQLLLYHVDDPWKYEKVKRMTISWIDSTLQIRRKQSFFVPYTLVQQPRIYYDRQWMVYFFAEDLYTNKVYVWRLHWGTAENELMEVKIPIRMTIKDFQPTADLVYLYGDFRDKPVVVALNWIDKTPKVLNSFTEEREEIHDMQTDAEGKNIFFVIKNPHPRVCKYYIKPYSNLIGGKKRLDLKYNGREMPPRTPQNFVLQLQPNNQLMAFGVYAHGCDDTFQGVFAASFDGDEMKNIFYRKFNEFGNIFKYYPPRRALRLQEKRERKAEQGKDWNPSRRLILHPEMRRMGNEWILVMENYNTQSTFYNNNLLAGFNPTPFTNYPRWSSYNIPNWQAWNPAMSSANRPNTTVQYTTAYAVVCGFDQRGRVQWDNVMRIEDVSRNRLIPTIQVGNRGDSLVLAYQKDSKLYTKFCYRQKTIQEEYPQKIEELLPHKLYADNDNWTFQYWYGDRFILFGTQLPKQATSRENPTKFWVLNILEYIHKPEMLESKQKESRH